MVLAEILYSRHIYTKAGSRRGLEGLCLCTLSVFFCRVLLFFCFFLSRVIIIQSKTNKEIRFLFLAFLNMSTESKICICYSNPNWSITVYCVVPGFMAVLAVWQRFMRGILVGQQAKVGFRAVTGLRLKPSGN